MSGSVVAPNDSRQIFSVGQDGFTVRDLLDAAYFRGEVQPVWDKLLRLVACEARVADEDREPNEDAVDAAAQAFRYEHDLITAEETEDWLAARGLTLDDFSDYFTRHHWSEMLGEPVEVRPVDYFCAPQELRELLIAEVMFSGELGQMANFFSRRLAVDREAGSPAEDAHVTKQREEFLQRVGLHEKEVMDWLGKLGRDEGWLNEMLRLEAAYDRERDQVLTPQARQRELGALRLQLAVFDVEIIEFDSRDAACEALFCVRDDGMAMEEVAREGRYPFRREQLLLEEIAPDMQQQFLSVIPGEVLEPIELEGAHRLYRVVSKREPDPEDPKVRDRVEQRILERHFSAAVSKHVHWDILLG